MKRAVSGSGVGCQITESVAQTVNQGSRFTRLDYIEILDKINKRRVYITLIFVCLLKKLPPSAFSG